VQHQKLQDAATHCRTLQHTAACYTLADMQHELAQEQALQVQQHQAQKQKPTAIRCNTRHTLQHTAKGLICSAISCRGALKKCNNSNTLQHTATYCKRADMQRELVQERAVEVQQYQAQVQQHQSQLQQCQQELGKVKTLEQRVGELTKGKFALEEENENYQKLLEREQVQVCCSVLQCVAVCCSMVPCGAVWCSVLQCVVACELSTTLGVPAHADVVCVHICIYIYILYKYMHIYEEEGRGEYQKFLKCVQMQV